MMSASKYGSISCPCCEQKSLQPNGAFLTCATCGLAITTQALARAVQHTHDPATLEQAIVTVSN
jgi:hypothetical protein